MAGPGSAASRGECAIKWEQLSNANEDSFMNEASGDAFLNNIRLEKRRTILEPKNAKTACNSKTTHARTTLVPLPKQEVVTNKPDPQTGDFSDQDVTGKSPKTMRHP